MPRGLMVKDCFSRQENAVTVTLKEICQEWRAAVRLRHVNQVTYVFSQD